jgi:hypothetical protein
VAFKIQLGKLSQPIDTVNPTVEQMIVIRRAARLACHSELTSKRIGRRDCRYGI